MNQTGMESKSWKVQEAVMEHCVNIEREEQMAKELTRSDHSSEYTRHSFSVSSENIQYSSSVSSEIDHQYSIQIKKTVQLMNEEIHGLPTLLPKPSIFRVHEGVRKVNEEAYTPILISIGPYHHKNPNLGAMEEHKLRYLHSFLQQFTDNTINSTSVEPYIDFMEQLADEAYGYYADPICLERHEFVKMMLLDACFIVRFLHKISMDEQTDDDPIFRSSWMKWQIIRDLTLLENQLPFFVLSKFHKTFNQDSEYVPFTMIAYLPIALMLPDKESEYLEETIGKLLSKKPASESKHLLDLAHNIYLPLFGKDSDSNRTSKSNSNGHEYCFEMSCVTELQEAGIRFRVDESDNVSIFDISFDHGCMKIPRFKVEDRTEIFLRNIVAYEQHSSTVETKYFTDYISFMDFLINSGKDVNALRLRRIINNWLGDDEKVAQMFNKLGDGVMVGESFYYSHICRKVNDHCEKPLNRLMAKLRRNYFYNPWASISTVAAVVLLLLTLTQTVATLFPLFD